MKLKHKDLDICCHEHAYFTVSLCNAGHIIIIIKSHGEDWCRPKKCLYIWEITLK